MANLVVIDASALLAAWLPNESYQSMADQLLECYVEGQVELCGPTLLLSEILNGLYIAVRGKAGHTPRVTLQVARQVWDLFEGLHLRLEDPSVLAKRILEFAIEYKLPSSYDAIYLALAENLECPLITADRKLLRLVGKKFNWVRPLWEWKIQ